jgi:hypothetical protein
LVATNTVFGEKVQAIMAVFGGRGPFVGVMKRHPTYASCQFVGGNEGTTLTKKTEKVLHNESETVPETVHRFKET